MMKTALAFIRLQGVMCVALPLAPLATLTAAEQTPQSKPNVLIIQPYAAEPAMHADLAWAAAGTGDYAPPHRDAAKARKARVWNEDGE